MEINKGNAEGYSKEEIIGIRKKILSMILPITIENILQMSAGFVSMAMIGRIDKVAIAALGLSMRITQIIWALFKGVTTGAAVFVAQAYGAQNTRKMRHVILQTLFSAIILVMILQQLIFWNTPMFLKVFNAQGELLERATTYLRMVSWGLPFVAIMLIVGGVLQAMGNAKTPMKITLIMNIINIILSWILIFGRIGIPYLGIKGAAIATVTAQFISAMIGLFILFNRNGLLGYSRSEKIRLDRKQILEIYKVGFPTAMESVFWQISAIILTTIILSFGDVTLAAYQLGLQAESISYMPAMGFGVAATAFIGQSVGARDRKVGKVYMRELIKGSLLLTSISATILIFFPTLVMRLLTNEADVISIGIKYLVVMGLVQIPQNISGVLNGALRGAGYTRVPMTVAAVGIWGVRVPFAWICTKLLGLDVTYIWIVIAVDLVVRFILSTILYKTKDIYNKETVFEE